MCEKITLVGGGLVGSLLSLILARKGFTVDVYESRDDMRKVDISAGRSINLALANRGIKPLQALGLMDEINDMLIPMRGRMVHIDGEPSTIQPYGQEAHEVIYSISRGQLNSFLMDKAEATGKVNFNFNHKVTDINFDNNTFTYQSNEKSETRQFTQIIGTDGANSPVRHAIHSVSSVQHDQMPLDHSYKELTILPDENGVHKLDKNALHIWPRGDLMLIALPNLDGSFTVTLFMPNEGYTSFDSIKTADEINHFFEANFADVKEQLADLVTSYQSNPTGKLATIKCMPWHYKDKALIIGDAAHAIVPFHGQGMNCGFEDCKVIAEILFDENLPEDIDWEVLFQQVENARKINADAIADMALENYVEMRDSVRQHEFLLQKQFAFKIQQWFPKRFTPRYAMVMFEHRPYSEAFELGKKHQQLLTELSDSYSCPSQLDGDMISAILDKYGL